MAPWPLVVAAGAAIGILVGLFGVGGSAIATPVLALLGVPGLLAVASPLPATIPAALAAVGPYARRGEVNRVTAGWSLLGAIPATVAGALLSRVVGGQALLVASGVVLVVIGWRLLQPVAAGTVEAGVARRENRVLLTTTAAGVGLFTGLLANGGGFLLVPVYLLLFGLSIAEAAGTSLVVVAVLTVPTLVTHVALGHVDWGVALPFALGAIPAGAVSARLAGRISGEAVQRAFGWLLIVSGVGFAAYRLVG
jgi:uncharacterized membrane protein YfcA